MSVSTEYPLPELNDELEKLQEQYNVSIPDLRRQLEQHQNSRGNNNSHLNDDYNSNIADVNKILKSINKTLPVVGNLLAEAGDDYAIGMLALAVPPIALEQFVSAFAKLSIALAGVGAAITKGGTEASNIVDARYDNERGNTQTGGRIKKTRRRKKNKRKTKNSKKKKRRKTKRRN